MLPNTHIPIIMSTNMVISISRKKETSKDIKLIINKINIRSVPISGPPSTILSIIQLKVRKNRSKVMVYKNQWIGLSNPIGKRLIP